MQRPPWPASPALACRPRANRRGLAFDILELRRAEIGDLHVEPAADLSVSVLGETDRARLGNSFQARGDIDAVSHQVAVRFLDDVPEMNADPEHDAAIVWHAGVALD